jgi:hypothetical protein
MKREEGRGKREEGRILKSKLSALSKSPFPRGI